VVRGGSHHSCMACLVSGQPQGVLPLSSLHKKVRLDDYGKNIIALDSNREFPRISRGEEHQSLLSGPRIWRGRFRGGLVCEAHRLLYHSTLGLRVIKKKKKK